MCFVSSREPKSRMVIAQIFPVMFLFSLYIDVVLFEFRVEDRRVRQFRCFRAVRLRLELLRNPR